MAIPQLGAFPAPPLLGQDQTTFNANAFNTLSYMSTWANEMNAVSSAVDVYYLQINGWYDSISLKYTNILAYSSDTLLYRNEAIAAKESIDGYVIPTNATYTPETIDTKIQNTRLDSFLGFNF